MDNLKTVKAVSVFKPIDSTDAPVYVWICPGDTCGQKHAASSLGKQLCPRCGQWTVIEEAK